MKPDKFSPTDPLATDSLGILRRQHSTFASSRRFAHVPRTSYLKQLNNHVQSEDPPLLIQAPSGAGKSALLAHWAAEYRRRNPETFVVEHYVGCGEGASDYLDMVRHVMLEFKSRFAIPDMLPLTPEKLIHDFAAWLWFARERTVIILDAVDQFQETEHAFDWFSGSLPPTIRLILSARSSATFSFAERESWKTMVLPPFDLAERQSLVHSFVKERKAALTSRQRRVVANDAGSANPLLLRTRLEEAHRAVPDKRVDEAIEYYLGAGTIEEMYDRLLRRLESELDESALRMVLSFLWGAKTGLTLKEIADVTQYDPKQILQILHRLEAYLLRTEDRYTLFHTSLAKAAYERWLSSSSTEIRLQLADYFQGESGDLRSTKEILYQLSHLQMWERLARVLADVPTLVQCFRFLRYEMLQCLNQIHSSFDFAKLCADNIREYQKSAQPETFVEALKDAGKLLEIIGSIDAAEELYSWGLHEVNSYNHQLLRATVLVRLGNFSTLRGEYQRAEQLLEEGLEIVRHNGTEEGEYAIASDLGTVAFYRGDYSRAEELFIQSLEHAEQNLNADEAARIRGNLGAVYARLGQEVNAEQCLRQILHYAEQKGDIEKEMTASANLGVVKESVGDHESAYSFFERSRKLAQTLGNKEHLAAMHGNLGSLLIRTQQPIEGAEHCEIQRGLAREIKDQRQVAIALTSIGTAMVMRGEYDRGSASFQEALEIYRRIEDSFGEGLVCGRLGYLCLHQNKSVEAEHHYRQEYNIAQTINHTPLFLEAVAGLGHSCRDAGHFDRAERWYAKLLEKANDTDDYKRIAEGTGARGVLAARRGNVVAALEQLNRAIEANNASPEDCAFWLLEKATLLIAGQLNETCSHDTDLEHEEVKDAVECLERIIGMTLYDRPNGSKNQARTLLDKIKRQSDTPTRYA